MLERVEIGQHVLYCADAMAVMPLLKAASVNAVVTDPPYGTQVDRDGYGRRGKWNGRQLIRGDADLALVDAAMPEFRRILAVDGWLALFRSPKRLAEFADVCRRHELLCRGEVIWDKLAAGLGGGLRYQHEAITFGSWGDAAGHCELPSLIREWVPKGQHGHRQQHHPHEKPLGVVSALIRYASSPDALVLDPFLGSGTTAIACERTGRRCIGVELDPVHFQTACRRLAEEVNRAPLFQQVLLFDEDNREAHPHP